MSDNHEIVFQAIDRLITAAVPERRAHLNALWQRYAPQFVLSQDQLGFVMKSAAFGAVIYTNKALLQIWLLGFAAWRAVGAYADIIRSCAAAGLLFDPPSVAALPGQSAVDAAFDRTLAAAEELNQIDNLASFTWPADVPPPGTESFSVPDKAAHDLVCIATAYFFLHELKHVAFAVDKDAPTDLVAEEIACDRFAQEFLLSGASAFATEIGKPPDEVLAKRVAAIALAGFVMIAVTPPNAWGGTGSHPPLAERLRDTFETIAIPPTAYPWNVGAALLLAKLRASGRPIPQFVFADEKTLFERLISLL
jgi:Peptidase U49